MLTLLLITCICLIGLVLHYASKAHQVRPPSLADEIRHSRLAEGTRLKLLVDAAQAERVAIPWFERAISSMGVLVFFSTLAVATVQAWQADQARSAAEVLQKEQKRLRDEAATQKELLEVGAEQLIANYDRNLKLGERERTLLRKTVEYRLQKPNRTATDTRFLFRAYTILNDWDAAAALLVHDEGAVTGAANPRDVVSAAQRLYVLGEPEAALAAVSHIAMDRPEISDRTRWDVWAIRWVVQPDSHETIANEATATLQIDRPAVVDSLAEHALALRQTAAAYRASLKDKSDSHR